MLDQAHGACRLCILAKGLGIALNHLTAALFQIYLLLVTFAALDHMLGVTPVDSSTCSGLEQL